ncbi:oxidoreductase [Novosphingopyxis sp. YJ-S2-01]|uniref:oxidoreductase n=1 Tax=Novosphingopyxis sp. YJ-S2-01 TaxID=2794021 RepID=UPI0018DCA502|nr:oxidoreductase [Novosphingopyxis sp. YJ-S2-01]MBH9537002.1 oxidoreductase [Novosphingopyxis sp. YJ-S2-01]
MLSNDHAVARSGTFTLGDRTVHRMGYGAMQLAGPNVFGPPKDRAAAEAVLREAMALGIDHIDTSDFYGPHITNRIIRDALAPYPDRLTIVTKLGAKRDEEGAWLPWNDPEALEKGLRDNLEHLGLDAMDVVNVRIMGSGEGGVEPTGESVARFVEPVARLQERGLVRHIGISTVTRAQVEEARSICPIVCVQNAYNLAHRDDDALIDWLAEDGIAYVPYFPLGGFSPLQSQTLEEVARDCDASPMQMALAWLLQRAPNIVLIPGTSSVEHLRQNVAAANLDLPAEAIAKLNGIGA